MSSGVKKLQDRISLKNENEWLKNAFRRIYASAQAAAERAEQESDNAAELSRALWLIAKQNGGVVRINEGLPLDAALGASLPIGAKLRSYRDAETGETVFESHVEPSIEMADEPVNEGIILHGDAAGIISER